MSNMTRSIERQYCKNNNISWKEYREKKYVIKDDNGNIVSDVTPPDTNRKPKRHFDNVKDYINMINFYRMVREVKEKKDKEKEQNESKQAVNN